MEYSIHDHWMLGESTGGLTHAEAIERCKMEAIHHDTVAGGDGGNVIAMVQHGETVGFGIKDDRAAGAVLIRWVLNSVSGQICEEEA